MTAEIQARALKTIAVEAGTVSPTLAHTPRMRLGEASELFKMTPRAIRFYEERGLVTVHRDRLNRRYYDGDARRRLAWISQLRAAGLSLPDIKYVLDQGETGDIINAAFAKIQARALHLRLQLETIDGLSQQLAEGRSGMRAPRLSHARQVRR